MVIFELLHPGIWGKKDKNDPVISKISVSNLGENYEDILDARTAVCKRNEWNYFTLNYFTLNFFQAGISLNGP